MTKILDRLAGYISFSDDSGDDAVGGWSAIFIVPGSVIFAAGMPWGHIFGYIGAVVVLLGALLNKRNFRFEPGPRGLLIVMTIFIAWGIFLSFTVAVRPSQGIHTVFAYFAHWMLPFAAGLWLPSRYRLPVLLLWMLSLFALSFISFLAFLGVFHSPAFSKEGMLFGLHNHIQLAAMLSLAAIIVYSLFLTPGKSSKATALVTVGGVFLLLFLILTGSRGWWLASAVAMAGMTIHHIIIDRGRTKALIVAVVGILFVLGSVAVFPQVRARINRTGLSDPNVVYRRNMAIMAWEVIKDNPLTGIGPGQVPFAKEYYDRMDVMNLPQETGYLQKKHFHNMYLQAAAEFGLPGALIFLFILFLSFRMLIVSPARFAGIYGPGITYGVLWSFAALAIAELFDCLLRGPAVAMEYFWVLGLCAGGFSGENRV